MQKTYPESRGKGNLLAKYQIDKELIGGCSFIIRRIVDGRTDIPVLLETTNLIRSPADFGHVVDIPIPRELQPLLPHHEIELEIHHNDLGQIGYERVETDQVLRPPFHVDPLLDVFILSEAKGQLGNYITAVDEKKQVAACSWLLAIIGFRSLNLGAVDNVDETFYVNGRERSADIIAYDPEANMLLIVDCTITQPRKDKISKIKNTSDYISQTIKDVLVFPVIFCSDTVTYRYEGGVSIVDKSNVEKLVETVLKGRRIDAKRFLHQFLTEKTGF